MNREMIEMIRRKFEAELQRKTSWGRNEVMIAFNGAVQDAAVEMLDRLERERRL